MWERVIYGHNHKNTNVWFLSNSGSYIYSIVIQSRLEVNSLLEMFHSNDTWLLITAINHEMRHWMKPNADSMMLPVGNFRNFCWIHKIVDFHRKNSDNLFTSCYCCAIFSMSNTWSLLLVAFTVWTEQWTEHTPHTHRIKISVYKKLFHLTNVRRRRRKKNNVKNILCNPQWSETNYGNINRGKVNTLGNLPARCWFLSRGERKGENY